MKLLRTVRADASDTFVFERAAEPGEWAVSGAFAFARADPEALERKARGLSFRFPRRRLARLVDDCRNRRGERGGPPAGDRRPGCAVARAFWRARCRGRPSCGGGRDRLCRFALRSSARHARGGIAQLRGRLDPRDVSRPGVKPDQEGPRWADGARQARDFRRASGYVGFDAEARRFGDARWNGEQSGEAMRTRLNGEMAR